MAANSESSTNNPIVLEQEQSYEDVSSEISNSEKEVKRESKKEKPNIEDRKARNTEKFQGYEADYKHYLMWKYFSDNTALGDPAKIFEHIRNKSSTGESATSIKSNDQTP